MELNNLKYKPGSRGQKRKIYGRGFGSGSKRGFKGNKGQGQRSTVNVRIGFEGGQTPLYRHVRKIGFNNFNFKADYNVVSLGQIETLGSEKVNAAVLKKARLIRDAKLPIKVIGTDDVKLSKKYELEISKITKGAAAIVEKAGGTIKLI
ncbi:MAG: 50S ribosomal protein L15 [Mycoplasmataceae bacterium]|jgi:large subunit ribosomal protein L15|nr:50S ribosomal protein L15 [Mycoplasmataceae bacterium]